MRLRGKWASALVGTAVLALLAGFAPAGAAEQQPDPEQHPAVKEMAERGVLRGYPTGKFEPEKPVTRLELAIVLARMLRAIESLPNAAQPAAAPKPPAKQSALPAGLPKWARGEFAYLAKRGYSRALPQMSRDLKGPVRQKDLEQAMVWALRSVAERGFIPPGDLAPPPAEPKVE